VEHQAVAQAGTVSWLVQFSRIVAFCEQSFMQQSFHVQVVKGMALDE
jgi:hypothetical protein